MPRGRKSIQKQGQDILLGKLKIGESKHRAKQNRTPEGIHSYSTLEPYLKHAILFLKWARKTYECSTMEEACDYVDEWLQNCCGEMSPCTIKLKAAAVAKMYGCSTRDFKPTLPRRRWDIKRSRGPAERDRHFSASKNVEFVAFCGSTDLRRHEFSQLTSKSLVYVNGDPCLRVKGRRGR